MSSFTKIREIYRQIRLYDDAFHELIRKSKEMVRAKGREAPYREMEVPENIIDMLVGFHPLQSHTKRGITDAAENDEPNTITPTSGAASAREPCESVHIEPFMVMASAVGSEIRKCCTAYGIEMRFNIDRVANCLLQLGSLYTFSAKNGFGSKMDQKLDFIRAAVLINAAVVRYGITGNEKHLCSSRQQLRDFHRNMLMSSVSTNDVNLVQFSEQIKAKLEMLRTNENKNLINLKKIRHFDEHVTDKKEREEAAISEIRLITTNNAKNYKELMVEVISKCLEVMKDPPCEFAVVGLGSLAREEITLSSDFEHVIILKNGTLVTEEIREYFRWFTVIFHVIIIGLGETIIPSVDIMGLCDHYSIENENNWFRDEFTPCGLSFDGMMPHACKTPVGRQMPTTNRVNRVELIQTAHKMADYLTKEEQFKNGYMLNDVLSTTCFVYGDKAVYDSFLARCWEIQQSFTAKEIFEEKIYMVEKVVELTSQQAILAPRYVDAKKTIYRPITVLLHYLAAISGIRFQSSFEILDELKGRKIINEESHHALCHALGIALEIRIRCYQTKHRRRNIMEDNDLAKLIGEKYVVDCRTTIMFLLAAVKLLSHRRFISHTDCDQLFIPSRESEIWHLSSVPYSLHHQHINADFIEDALRSVKKLIQQFSNEEISIGRARLYMLSQLSALMFGLGKLIVSERIFMYTRGREDQESYMLLLDISVWVTGISHDLGPTIVHQIFDILMKATMHYNEKNFKEADKWLERCQGILEDRPFVLSDEIRNAITTLEVYVKREVMHLLQLILYITAALDRKDNTEFGEMIYRIELGRCLIQISKNNYGYLRLLLEQLKLNTKSFPPRELHQFVGQLCGIFRDFGYPVDAVETMSLLTTTENVKVEGDILEQVHRDIPVNNSQHYRYMYNNSKAGKYASFTFNSSRYQHPVKNITERNRIFHGLMIFSSITYGDMIAMIMYVLNNYSFIPSITTVIDYSPAVSALMALCENVRTDDVDIFEDLLRSTPKQYMKMKILQPFIYAAVKDLSAYTDALKPVISTQNYLLTSLFHIPVHLKSHPYTLAASHFMNLGFIESVKIIWKILHGPCSHDPCVLEYFLTNVLTIMISRKRECPLVHLSKCREISVKQSLYYTIRAFRNSSIFDDSTYFKSSNYYIEDTNLYALCHNLAVDFSYFDHRFCAAFVWKLIHWGAPCDSLHHVSVSLLLEAINSVFFTSLNFNILSRV